MKVLSDVRLPADIVNMHVVANISYTFMKRLNDHMIE